MSEFSEFNTQDSVDQANMPILEETYPLIPPFAYAVILTNPVSRRTRYEVTEAPLSSEEERIFKFIKDVLIEELDVDFQVLSDQNKSQEYLKRQVNLIVKTYRLKLEPQSYDKIMYYIDRDLIGYGIIQPLMKDPMIEDISCDGLDKHIYVWHRNFESIPTNIKFSQEIELDSFIIKLAQRSGRHISIARPLLDAALPDGSRLQISYGREVTQFGSTFTMRRFRQDPLTITDQVIHNTIDSRIAAWYWFLIEQRMSLLVAGGTAAGKTSFLGALAMMLKPDLKVVSIEDTAELNLGLENWIPSVSREGFGDSSDGESRGKISMFDLLRAAMRQRPDFIVVGEIRGAEAYTLFQAISTGHSGMGTIHGESVAGVISRLESQPMNVPRPMLKSLNLIHIQRKVRTRGKFARRAVEITEIVDLDPVTKQLISNPVFERDAGKDVFRFLGRSYLITRVTKDTGMSDQDCWREIEKRETVIRWLVKRQIKHFRDVTAIFGEYYSNPDKVFERAKRGLSA
ncbi:MAG: type II/IV secretion system ATPase subunit [Candidatus Heimdallarchaeota archaeon]|nr:type II/IV secretion system ATPase subunit [Candidatus Heimdallarchaeota archaeon]MDH5645468.1 type II/IV secretion system ATPase subunit [Candidatus Heimdallarchaeota archaeon]